MRNKRGAMAVFLTLFFIGLVSVSLLFITGAKASALHSSSAALSRLWGQSILAEYDVHLQQRYHLFGFYGYPQDIKRKLTFYGQETFDEKGISWEITSCSLYAYSLQNVDVLKKQMVEAGKLAAAKVLPDPNTEIIPVAGHEKPSAAKLFADLPSGGMQDGFSLGRAGRLFKELTSFADLLKGGTDTYFELAYIFSHCKDKLADRNLGESYLTQEIEYILCGRQSDAENEKAVKRRIIAMREVVNLLFLNGNSKRRNEALAVAEVLTPGPASVATQQTLLAMWALAESHNDYQLLLAGHRVPVRKSEKSWAVDLDSVINYEAEGCIYTGSDEGESYADYLKLMLWMLDERIRILRMMDLIQMQMRWQYYDSFLLGEYHGGVSFTYEVQGFTEQVELSYLPES